MAATNTGVGPETTDLGTTITDLARFGADALAEKWRGFVRKPTP